MKLKRTHRNITNCYIWCPRTHLSNRTWSIISKWALEKEFSKFHNTTDLLRCTLPKIRLVLLNDFQRETYWTYFEQVNFIHHFIKSEYGVNIYHIWYMVCSILSAANRMLPRYKSWKCSSGWRNNLGSVPYGHTSDFYAWFWSHHTFIKWRSNYQGWSGRAASTTRGHHWGHLTSPEVNHVIKPFIPPCSKSKTAPNQFM